MRLTCTVLAVLMLAACPPRRSRVVYVQVQPCVVTVPPVVVAQAPPPHEPSVRASDPVSEALLGEWERKMADVRSVRTEVTLKRTDAVFRKHTNYSGSLLWMKPSFAFLRLDNSGDPTKTDYEAYICDGKSIFAYDGLQKVITELKLPLPSPWADDLLYQTLVVMKTKDVSARFDITLLKKDEHYIYLDIKPRTDGDKRAFQHARVALYGPGPATEKCAYLPAQVYVLKPSGDSETWKFSNPQMNLPSVSEENFALVLIKGWNWKKAQAPAQPSDQP